MGFGYYFSKVFFLSMTFISHVDERVCSFYVFILHVRFIEAGFMGFKYYSKVMDTVAMCSLYACISYEAS